VRNMYIQEVWVKCPRERRVLEHVKAFIKDQRMRIISEKGNATLQIQPDVDPVG